MAFFVNEEKNIKESKAVKEFTDRVEPRKVFWKNYNLIKSAILNEQEIPIQIVTYYGIGGTGKTRLLERIRYELDQDAKEAKYCYIDFEKIRYINNDDVLSILNAIKSELNRKYGFEFPLFDLAAYEYKIKSGMEASKPELENILSKNKELGFLINFMGEIPLVGTFAKIISVVDEGSNILRNRFKDKELKSRVARLDNMDLEQIRSLLPYYFATDFQENIKDEKCPFVFQLDTYERLVNELTQVGSVTKVDNWLKSKYGLIRNVKNVLWVIAGREKLKWEEEDENWKGNLDQHLLGDLSEVDSKFFLKSAGIEDEELITQIYNMTSGTPVFLDMCVDTYYKFLEKNQKPEIKDFSGDRVKLIERFFTYMNDTEKDFVTVLAFIGNWTDDNIEERLKPILGNFSFNLYEKIKQFSFVIKEGENYKIHETIRDVITQEASQIIKNKFNKSIKERQEEKIKQIEEMETVQEVQKIVTETKKETEVKVENETEIQTKQEDMQVEAKTGVMYLQTVKKKKYSEVIDEIVNNIIEYLYKKPKFTKANRNEYIEMVNNLLEKIETYLDVYDGRYEPSKLEPILNYKIFKNTYEYKRLKGLYLCLCRYYEAMYKVIGGNCEYEKLFNFRNGYSQIIECYRQTKNLYKGKKERAKQISYMVKILADGFYTLENQKDLKNYHNYYFDAYELNTYRGILRKNGYGSTDIESILISYTARNYKEFKESFDSFYNIYKDTDNMYYKRLMVRFSLAIIYEEFKGRPGTGYLMRDYRLRKEASKKFENTNRVDKSEIEAEINEEMTKKKKDFINKYLNIAMELISKNKNLIDSFSIKAFIKVADALYDESIADEEKLKIFDFFIEIENEILESDNRLMIEEYAALIYRFSKLKETFSDNFLLENTQKFLDITQTGMKILDDIYVKMIDIYGKYDKRTRRIETKYKVDLMLNYHGMIEDFISIYQRHGYKNSDDAYYRTDEDIRILLCKMLLRCKPYNKEYPEGETLIKLFNALFIDYKDFISYYFDNYKTIPSYQLDGFDIYFKRFMILPMAIYYKTGDMSYYKQMIDFFYDKIKDLKIVPTVNMFADFSYLLDFVWEYSIDEKYDELVDYSLKLLGRVFNNEYIENFPESKVYNESDYRCDLALYSSIILSKIAYNKYLSNKDKQIYAKNEYYRNKSGRIVLRESENDERSCELQLYKEYNFRAENSIAVMNKIYQDKENKQNNYIETKKAKSKLYNLQIIDSWENKKNSKELLEFIKLSQLFSSAVLGRDTFEQKNSEVEKIIKKHTAGIFQDKENSDYYIEFQKTMRNLEKHTKFSIYIKSPAEIQNQNHLELQKNNAPLN